MKSGFVLFEMILNNGAKMDGNIEFLPDGSYKIVRIQTDGDDGADFANGLIDITRKLAATVNKLQGKRLVHVTVEYNPNPINKK